MTEPTSASCLEKLRETQPHCTHRTFPTVRVGHTDRPRGLMVSQSVPSGPSLVFAKLVFDLETS